MQGASFALAAAVLVLAGCVGEPGYEMGNGRLIDPGELGAHGAVTGVVKGLDGRPVEGAAVGIAQRAVRATTGKDGWFLLKGLEDGVHQVVVSAPRYYPFAAGARVRVGEVTELNPVIVWGAPFAHHVTVSMNGTFDLATAGPPQGGFDARSFFACPECVLGLWTDEPADALIVDIVAAADDPNQQPGLYRLYLEGPEGALAVGGGRTPINFVVDGDALGSQAGWFELTVNPGDPLPSANGKWVAYLTAFFDGPPPRGWSAVPRSTDAH